MSPDRWTARARSRSNDRKGRGLDRSSSKTIQLLGRAMGWLRFRFEGGWGSRIVRIVRKQLWKSQLDAVDLLL